MDHSFRFEPTTALEDRVIARPRVTVLLAERFEHRLTTLCAPAGYGKTTALAQAVRSNLLDPTGTDIWLGARPADAEPKSVLSGLLQACDKDASGDIDSDITTICEEVWRRSPSRVTLIIDDVHHLDDACGPMLDQLLHELPRNGQMLLSGRRIPPLRLARMRAHQEVLEITQEQLQLDDRELSELAEARGHVDISKLSRHVASADLRLTAGPAAAADFLWEEVLGSLDPARLDALCCASLLEEIDDALALALSDGLFTAAELTVGLPMVETHDHGSRRFHAILRETLASRLSPQEQQKTLQVAARVELGRDQLTEACDLFARAGDRESAVSAARAFMKRPVLRTRMDGLRSLRHSIADIAPDSALRQLVEASCHLNLAAEATAEGFITAAQTAREEGDALVEAVALLRIIQTLHSDARVLDSKYADRIFELEAELPYAAGIGAFLRSFRYQHAGDPEQSLAEVHKIAPLGHDALILMRAERQCDLGRPENVGAELTPRDLETLPPGADMYIAFAMWLRGELAPELALPVVKSMINATLGRRFTLPSVSVLAVATHIALTAGELGQARGFLSRCLDLCRLQDDALPNLMGTMSQAALASAEGDDARAAELLDPKATRFSLKRWPSRPHLLGLPLIYLTRPESRAPLDGMSFGPSLTLATAAGRALVELRETGSPRKAAELTWHQDTVLRVHVLPHHLAELAAAAASEGVVAAEELLEKLPNARPGIVKASSSKRHSVAAWSDNYLESVPPEPSIQVSVHTLGAIELLKDDVPVSSPDWTRRTRVQELLGLLVEHRTLTRDAAAAALWPTLDEEKSASNLRVSLSRLQSVLEPDRDRNERPAYVLATPTTLTLRDTVKVDSDEFDEIISEAQAIDRAGAPGEAIALYEKAVQMVRGHYLANIDTIWVSMTRLRLDSLARTAMTRLAELQLAGGEPEQALYWAAKAQSANPIDERAGRLMILALLATSDRAGALAAASALTASLQEAGLTAEPETCYALQRAGLTVDS